MDFLFVGKFMTEEFTLKYKPIEAVNVTSTKKVTASFEMILGMAIMASQLISTDRFSIQRSNQDLIDIQGCLKLSYVVNPGQPVTYPHDGYFSRLHVQFMSVDFVQGAIYVCTLLGYGWNGIITRLQYMNQPWPLQSDFYLGEIKIEQPPGYDMSPIRYLEQIVAKKTVDSLIQSLDQCFHFGDGIYIYLPSLLTMSSEDPNYETISASSMATPYLKQLPPKYHQMTSWYIFNVCAAEKHRGKGYTKSVMISQINSLIQSGVTSFLLEVDPTNTPAWKLYQSLGFYKIDLVENGKYDLYYLPTANDPHPIPRLNL
jgi:hypothetical protein